MKSLAPDEKEPIMISDKELLKYVRSTESSRLEGLLLAQKIYGTDHVVIGWSKCNPKDRFNKTLAYTIASGRIDKTIETDNYLALLETPLPHSELYGDMYREILAFTDRCERYYHSTNISFAGPVYELPVEAPKVREPAAVARIVQLIES